MKNGFKIVSAIIVLLIFVALFVPNEYKDRWQPSYVLQYMEYVGNVFPFPSLANSIKFDGFLSSISSSLFILTYPVQVVTWLLVQIISFVNFFFGGLGAFFS